MSYKKSSMYVKGSVAKASEPVFLKSSIDPNINVRSPFTQADYDSFRPNEAGPKNIQKAILDCRRVYIHTSIVRQVVDLMTDFACDGINLAHKNPNIEAFFRAWMEKLNIDQVSEEFARHSIIDCNVIIKRITAKLNKPIEKQWIQASPDIKINVEKPSTQLTREIPVKYMFLDPICAKWDYSSIPSIFSGGQLLYRFDTTFLNRIRKDSKQYNMLPQDFRDILNKGSNGGYFPLDMDKVYVAFNKKDSWDQWATPYLVSVLPDINYKEKLRLADLTALDGTINFIRLWKLGDHNKDILPGSAAFEKLTDAIASHTGGGALDIIWDSMIDMKDYYPPLDKILGPEKYQQVNQDILVGLGVPDVLLGGKGSNFSNSFIQLKTIIERLQAIRDMIIAWLSKEIKFICNSFNIDTPPVIVFNNMNLYDENVSKQLMIDLFDRGILSDETILDQFGQNIEIEDSRMRRQDTRMKNSGRKPLGPYHQDQPVEQGGRPPNTKDTTRKTRKSKPKATAIISSINTINHVFDEVSKYYLEKNNLKNLRKLTNLQREEFDHLVKSVVSCININEKVDKNFIEGISPDNGFIESINNEVSNFFEENDRTPTVEELKYILAMEIIK